MGNPIAKPLAAHQPTTQQTSSTIVEWVGLPGAGKTTVSQAAYLKLQAQDVPVLLRQEILDQWARKSKVKKLLQLRPESLNHWDILRSSVLFAMRVKPLNFQSFLRAWRVFSNIKRADIAAHTYNNSILLLDQGWIQEVWSACLSGTPPHADSLKPTMSPLFHKRKTLIVHCKVDIETALNRIKGRKTMESRFDLMETGEAHARLQKYHHYLQTIIDCARTFNIPVLELDGSQPIEDQSATAANWMAQHHQAM